MFSWSLPGKFIPLLMLLLHLVIFQLFDGRNNEVTLNRRDFLGPGDLFTTKTFLVIFENGGIIVIDKIFYFMISLNM